MADLNAKLKRTLDGVAPQHKVADRSELEFSEGSDGALHTKVTDTNGNPIDPRQVDVKTLEEKIDALNTKLGNIGGSVSVDNFPTTQAVTGKVEVNNQPDDYPDSKALTELQAIKQENAEIKQKLDAVNARLNETLDMQLTGSNVEEPLPVKEAAKNITVLANAKYMSVPGMTSKKVLENIDVSDYKYLIVHFIPAAGGNSMNYKVSFLYKKGDTKDTMQAITVLQHTGSSNMVSERIDVLFMNIDISIANNLERDHTFGEIFLLGVKN